MHVHTNKYQPETEKKGLDVAVVEGLLVKNSNSWPGDHAYDQLSVSAGKPWDFPCNKFLICRERRYFASFSVLFLSICLHTACTL